MYEIHLIIRGALDDALGRGLVTRNVVVTCAPKQRSLPPNRGGVSLTDADLRQLMRTDAGHRPFPLYWVTAMTGAAARCSA